MTSKIIYEGNLRTTLTHLYSGATITNDAPLDNHGLAQAFSPTDMVATALGSCIITTMGIKTRDMNIDLTGTELTVTKVMGSEPRRIAEIHITIQFPDNHFTDKEKTIMENIARTCPVAKSLHPDLKQELIFVWNR
ncbi:MAG: OsmC family protein [Bacteroidetes bacterium]|nr:OsmC family protein [Bacteroidota bacterium]